MCHHEHGDNTVDSPLELMRHTLRAVCAPGAEETNAESSMEPALVDLPRLVSAAPLTAAMVPTAFAEGDRKTGTLRWMSRPVPELLILGIDEVIYQSCYSVGLSCSDDSLTQ